MFGAGFTYISSKSLMNTRTKKSRSTERDFFIHCENNGISSHRRCVYCRLDDMQFLMELMIYKAYA